MMQERNQINREKAQIELTQKSLLEMDRELKESAAREKSQIKIGMTR